MVLDLYTNDGNLVGVYANEIDAQEAARAAYSAALFDASLNIVEDCPPYSAFSPVQRTIRARGLTVTVYVVIDPTAIRR
jgi:hypothetical protein